MSPVKRYRDAPSGGDEIKAKRRAYIQQHVPPTSVMQRRMQVATVDRDKRIAVLREHLTYALQRLVHDGLLVDSLQRRSLTVSEVGLLTTACTGAVLDVVEQSVTTDSDLAAATVVRRALIDGLTVTRTTLIRGDAVDQLLEAVHQASEDVMTNLRAL